MKVVKINSPVWNGGNSYVTVGDYHMRGQDGIRIEVMWKDKAGNRRWPEGMEYTKEEFYKLEPYPVNESIRGRRIFLSHA